MQSQEPAKVEQVGGTHYQAAYQHWDLVDESNVAYLEACATKYVSRWEKKGGVDDLLKAISFIDKRLASIEKVEAANHLEGVGFSSAYRKFTVPTLKIMRWFDSAKVGEYERGICLLILCWETALDLTEAKSLIHTLIGKQAMASANYVNQDRP